MLPSILAAWIEALDDEGITGACGFQLYCPSNPNTRGQMAAVFLAKALGLHWAY